MTDERYKLNIKQWGPAGWHYLIAAALQYPPTPTMEDKNAYRDFFTSNGKCIPCSMCRGHYQDNLNKHPLTDEVLSSPRSLSEWINKMQNEVNASANKPLVPYLQMIADYLPPSIAWSVLKLSEQEKQKLAEYDQELNAAYLSPTIRGVAKSTYRQDAVCSTKSWIFWLLIVIIGILLALFIWAIIKSACNAKQVYPSYQTSNVLA
jgi:hypothetical protein